MRALTPRAFFEVLEMRRMSIISQHATATARNVHLKYNLTFLGELRRLADFGLFLPLWSLEIVDGGLLHDETTVPWNTVVVLDRMYLRHVENGKSVMFTFPASKPFASAEKTFVPRLYNVPLRYFGPDQ